MQDDRCLCLFGLAGLTTERLSIPGLRSAICIVINIKCEGLIELSEQGRRKKVHIIADSHHCFDSLMFSQVEMLKIHETSVHSNFISLHTLKAGCEL